MSRPENVKAIIRRMNFKTSEQNIARTQRDMRDAYEQSRRSRSTLASGLTGRMIMWKRLTQAALGLCVLIAGILAFANLNGSIAFADVLAYIQQRSYAFDLTVKADNATNTLRGQVLQPGHMRFDGREGLGKVSTIVDMKSGKSLILIHPLKTAKYVDFKTEYGSTGANDLLSLCSLPVENLWNLQDRSEEDLGGRTFDGTTAKGYRVVQDDDDFKNEITLWASARSGRPLSVEIVSTALKPPYGKITWQLTDFDLETDLDESIFSMDVPNGYTLTDQTSVQDVEFSSQSSAEALKITRALQLCQANQQTEAIASLMSVDWTKPIVFGKEPYALTLTEKELVLLKQAEREAFLPGIMTTCATLRKISFELKRLSQEAQSAKDYAKAETYLKTGWRLSQLVGPDQEDVLIVRLSGIAMRKLFLVELKALYERTHAQAKLIEVQQKIQTVDAQHQALTEQLEQHQ